ncbi:MAG: sigma-54-dependent Fis family transcriptional regulator, partial [Desulfobulbaceae bacterium]|nr:sigma-54-dependent Fis family transcriptional regulator [Desulfobulbaceae bacterium]
KVHKKITGISEQAQAHLCRYSWPGNVCQLEHAIERACILCQDTTISSEYLPDEMVGGSTTSQSPDITELSKPEEKSGEQLHQFTLTKQDQQTTEKILAALKKAGGNKAKASRILNIDRSTLYRKMRELHINADMFG